MAAERWKAKSPSFRWGVITGVLFLVASAVDLAGGPEAIAITLFSLGIAACFVLLIFQTRPNRR